MKEIKAIIQPFKLEEVLHALESIEGLPGVTISKVAGWGRTRARDATDRIHVAGHAFVKKSKIEIVVQDDIAEQVADAIARTAHTGRTGDGKLFIYNVVEAVRIRTGERGPSVL